MKILKILALHHTLPDVNSQTTLFLKNLLPVLKTKVKVKIFWVIYTPEKINLDLNNSDIEILDIQDFKNADDIIHTVKPDIIYAEPFPNFVSYALIIAARYHSIPTFGIFDNDFKFNIGRLRLYASYISGFFQNKVPTETLNNKKIFMKRGRFFIYKYLFLIRTQIAIHYRHSEILKEFFMFLKIFLTYTKYPLYPKFSCDIHFVDSERLILELIEAGFKKSTLQVTGNPMYDHLFHRINNFQNSLKNSNKIRVLLITGGLYEHGQWTKKQRDDIVDNIVRTIVKNKNNIELTIKIHPSSEKLDEYKQIVGLSDKTIPIYQKGDILEYLINTDVVLAFCTGSALTYALLSKKPIVICNFYKDQEKDLFLKRHLALECNDKSSLITCILQVNITNPATQDKIDKYIKDFHFSSDGLAAERVSNGILNLIESYKSKS